MTKSMRNLDDVLSDICIAFDTDIETFNSSRVLKQRSNEHIAMISQAFIVVALYTFCVNITQLAKYLQRSPGAVSIANQKAISLLKSKSPFAMNFRERIKNSCNEGKLLVNYYETKNV